MRFLLMIALFVPTLACAAEVNVETIVRAESDHMIRANMAAFGIDFRKMVHVRVPTTPDNQPVIRMNQDTLYSATVLDLSEPVEITLPDAGGVTCPCMWSTRTITCSWSPSPGPTG